MAEIYDAYEDWRVKAGDIQNALLYKWLRLDALQRDHSSGDVTRGFFA